MTMEFSERSVPDNCVFERNGASTILSNPATFCRAAAAAVYTTPVMARASPPSLWSHSSSHSSLHLNSNESLHSSMSLATSGATEKLVPRDATRLPNTHLQFVCPKPDRQKTHRPLRMLSPPPVSSSFSDEEEDEESSDLDLDRRAAIDRRTSRTPARSRFWDDDNAVFDLLE